MQLRRTEIESIESLVNQLPAVVRVNAQLAASGGDIRAVNYTLVEWDGGSDAYLWCSLDSRAPAYMGTCTDAMPYTLTSVDTAPYACAKFSNGTTLTGDPCTEQITLQLDCKAICTCTTGDADAGTISVGCSNTRYACHCLWGTRLCTTRELRCCSSKMR
jgi:hypothetical protein